MPKPKLLLASASPRRKELLRQHGYEFQPVVARGIEEIYPDYLTVGEITLFNAKLKATAVARRNPNALTLAADTLVSLDGIPIGKPRNRAEAARMLKRLSGRTHEVFTSVWLMRPRSGKMIGFTVISSVTFRSLTASEIKEYLDQINPLDKAGAYAAQEEEEAAGVIARIDGSVTNVIGLPMEALDDALKNLF